MTEFFTPNQAKKSGYPVGGPSYESKGRLNNLPYTVVKDGFVIGKVWKLYVAGEIAWSYSQDLFDEDPPHIENLCRTRTSAIYTLEKVHN